MGEAKDWYSVREAAAYLGKSEPTIFRWMKEGVLGFYKVGRATRFTQESLDAVIEKTTGAREAAGVVLRCAACGNSQMVDGQLQSTGRIYFKPDKSKFWTLTDSMVGLRAKVCTACGFVQIHADTQKLGKLKPDGAADSTLADEDNT